MIRFSTAGESHGEALIALVSGLPAGVPVDLEFVNRELWRRQQGYGRGGRMKIETDQAHMLSRRAPRQDHRVADRDRTDQSRLEELAGEAARGDGRSGKASRGGFAAAGPRGPGRRTEVQLS